MGNPLFRFPSDLSTNPNSGCFRRAIFLATITAGPFVDLTDFYLKVIHGIALHSLRNLLDPLR
ncbi:MAG: hypothetical protein NTV29_16240 [Planctomycetota bacterium]|nr:hypothetical protein [Planctomycetota bacterium]